jgi:adenylosuccinate synthase
MIGEVLGVVAKRTTRGATAAFEIPPPLGDQLRELGGEYSATRAVRAAAAGSMPLLFVMLRVNRLTGLAVTKLDVLDTLPEIRIATAYEIDQARFDSFPYDLSLLDRARQSTNQCRVGAVDCRRARFPTCQAARAYLDRVRNHRRADRVRIGRHEGQIISV